MKTIKKIVILVLLTTTLSSFSQDNIFIGRDFWKTNPTIAQVEEKIKEGNSPSEMTKFGFDAVVYSLLAEADENVIKHLLTKKGNDVNKLTHDGRTYIFWASYKNNLPIVKHLLEKGAKTDVIDDKGYSLLNFTAVGGTTNTNLYDLLIAKGANIVKDKTPKGANALLLIASSLKNLKMVDYFTSKGLDINTTDAYGNGIFNYAAQKENYKVLKLLIDKGIPYKNINKNGGNAMFFATKSSRGNYNSLEYFKYLENLGINPNIINKDSKTPFHNLVSRNSDLKTLNYFIEKGANINQADKEGNTALLLATQRNSLEVITFLTNKTKDINHVNKKGYTALTNALRNTPETVAYLLNKGAKVNLIDSKGYDLAYHLFKNYQAKDVFKQKLKLLTDKGLNLTNIQKDGTTLYHLAVEKQNINMLNFIKPYAININAKSKEGITALQKAVMKGKNHQIIKNLIANGANKNVVTDFDETLYDLAKENEALANTDISYLK